MAGTNGQYNGIIIWQGKHPEEVVHPQGSVLHTTIIIIIMHLWCALFGNLVVVFLYVYLYRNSRDRYKNRSRSPPRGGGGGRRGRYNIECCLLLRCVVGKLVITTISYLPLSIFQVMSLLLYRNLYPTNNLHFFYTHHFLSPHNQL